MNLAKKTPDLTAGESNNFKIPEFARHKRESWRVGHLEAPTGQLKTTGNVYHDLFQKFVLDIFHTSSAKMLQKDNLFSWNVWVTAPELADSEG